MSYSSKLKSKERYILEWAFEKPKQQQDQSAFKNKTKEKLNIIDKILNESKILTDDDLIREDDATLEAEFERKHRNILNSNKSELTEKRILNQLLDFELLELSKQRLKCLEKLDLQKNSFAKKQSKKGLPVLKNFSNALPIKSNKFKFYDNNHENNNDNKIITSKSGRKISFRENLTENQSAIRRNDFEIEYIKKRQSSTFSNSSTIFQTIRRRNTLSTNYYYEDDFIQLPIITQRAQLDRRFDNLINLVMPCYNLNEEKDIENIIRSNEALFVPSKNQIDNLNHIKNMNQQYKKLTIKMK